ncbi:MULTISPECIES: acyl carrier protein [Chitinophagaceae]
MKPASNDKLLNASRREASKPKRISEVGAKSTPVSRKRAKMVPAKDEGIYDPALMKRLKNVIKAYVEDPELLDGIESDSDVNFAEKLNIDSVDMVEIIVDSEEAFGIKIEDEEIKALNSFDAIYRLISSKIALSQQ